MKPILFRSALTGLVGALLLVSFSNGIEGAQKSPDTVACKGEAYVIDPDPKGLNIRSSPDKIASVVKVIPKDPDGTIVTLAGSLGSWVMIRRAEALGSDFRFEGEGWVHAPLLAVMVSPDLGKKIVLRRTPEDHDTAVKSFTKEEEVRLAGCRGGWLQVTSGKATGWIASGDFCGNPVTTCP